MNDSPYVAAGIAVLGMIQPGPDPMAECAERAYRMLYELYEAQHPGEGSLTPLSPEEREVYARIASSPLDRPQIGVHPLMWPVQVRRAQARLEGDDAAVRAWGAVESRIGLALHRHDPSFFYYPESGRCICCDPSERTTRPKDAKG